MDQRINNKCFYHLKQIKGKTSTSASCSQTYSIPSPQAWPWLSGSSMLTVQSIKTVSLTHNVWPLSKSTLSLHSLTSVWAMATCRMEDQGSFLVPLLLLPSPTMATANSSRCHWGGFTRGFLGLWSVYFLLWIGVTKISGLAYGWLHPCKWMLMWKPAVPHGLSECVLHRLNFQTVF